MSDQPTYFHIADEFNEPQFSTVRRTLPEFISDGKLVPVEPTEHQHQWLPWLTLPNGSSWTQCVPCGEQFQYDHS